MLRLARLDAELNVIAVAVHLGLSENTIRRYERGDTEPPGWAIDAWMKRCGVTYRLFVGPERELREAA
jgi:transcriptional regulator with XRE-family HTH domain